MANGQMNQATGGAPDGAVAFTAGEGTNNLEVHDTNGNLDMTSNDWRPAQGVAERYQDKGDTTNPPSSERLVENASYDAEKDDSVSGKMTTTQTQNQPVAHANGSKIQPSAAELAAASIDEKAIAEDKFGKNGVREFNKITHLMVHDPNSGEKLADGYDIGRGSTITLLSKYKDQSNWKKKEAA